MIGWEGPNQLWRRFRKPRRPSRNRKRACAPRAGPFRRRQSPSLRVIGRLETPVLADGGLWRSMCGRPLACKVGGGRFFGYAFACAHVSGLLVQRGLLAKMVCAAGDPNNPATSIGRCFARFISCCGSNDPVHLSASRARSARRVQTMSERADLVRRPLAQELWRRMRSARRSPSASRRSAPFCWRAPPPRAWRACAPTDMGGEGAAVGGVIEREHASSRVDGRRMRPALAITPRCGPAVQAP